MDTSSNSLEVVGRLILEAYVRFIDRFAGDAEFCRLRLQYLRALDCLNRGMLPSYPAEQLEFVERMRELALWIGENSDDEADASLAQLMLRVVEGFRASALDELGLHAGAKEARALSDKYLKEAISRLRRIDGVSLRPQNVGAESPAARGAECVDSADTGMSDEG